jgi:segregation and condensation protein A
MPDDIARPSGCTGDTLWDDWDAPLLVPPAPILHLDGFDGPIDLLLDLAERQRFDLGRISIVALVDQFVAASLLVAAYVPIERRADWLVMAARLVLLRARLLWPATQAAADEAEREAEREVARLDELRVMRAAAAWLQARPQLGIDTFARGRSGPDRRAASYMALMEACLTVLRGRDEQPTAASVYRPPRSEVFRIPETLDRLRALVAALTEPRPLEAFFPRVPAQAPLLARSAVAATFMAALELCRAGEVGLAQAEPFGAIVVHSVEASGEHAPQANAAWRRLARPNDNLVGTGRLPEESR